MIYGSVRNSVLFPGVYVSEGAEIVDSIVMSDSVIGENTQIYKCIIGEEVKVGKNVRMGIGENIPNELKPHLYDSGITVVGKRLLYLTDVR